MQSATRVLSALFSSCVFAAAQAPSITYPAPSLPAIKLGDPLPENLSPTNSGGAVPAIPYRRVDTFAGSGGAGGNNATGTAATFNGPWGISRDAQGNFYVADFAGKRIRKVTPAGVVSLIDEFGTFEPIATAVDPATGHLYCSIATHRILRYVNKNAANYPAQEPVYGPETNFADSVIVYIGASTSGTTDASGTSARLNAPHALSVLDGFLYVADKGNNRIRKVNLTTAAVETVTFTGGALDGPEGIVAAADGSIYISNTGGNDLIQKIENGVIRTYAGSGSGYANGMAAHAKFDNPRGMALDGEGNLLVAEGNNNAIRKITPDGWVASLAGATTGGYDASKGYTDAIGDEARFNSPRGLVFGEDGLLYITDNTNHRIRRLSVTGYEIDPPLPAGLAFDASNGVISGTATELTPEGGELFPHYQNTFGSGPGTATLHGTAAVTTDYLQRSKLQLTTATANQSGGFTIPAGNLNAQQLEVAFLLETTKSTGGGQGLSYNFGDGASGGSPILAETGNGVGLSLVFDPYDESGGGVKGVRLLYGTKYGQPGTTPGVNGVVAYSPSVTWAGRGTAVVLTVDALSRVSVTLDGEPLFSDIPLPAGYAAADKSKWTHSFAARTDATANDAFAIDDLSIRQSLAGAALYQVTARNGAGSATAPVRINLKEAPAVAFAFNLKLEEDKPASMYQAVGQTWGVLPSLDQNDQAVSVFLHAFAAAYTRERAVIAADANCRHVVGIGTLPDSTTLEQRYKSRALYRHSDGDSTWQRLTAAGNEPWMTVASNADGTVLVAGTHQRTVNGGTTPTLPGLLRTSTDSGVTWTTHTLSAADHWISSIAISGDGARIYAGAVGTSGGTIYVSRDRGSSWQTINPSGGFESVMHVSCDFAGDTVQAVVGDFGMFRSTNAGASWSVIGYTSSVTGLATFFGMSGNSTLQYMGTYQGRLNLQTTTGWQRLDWPNTNVVEGGMYASNHDGRRFHVIDAIGYLNSSRDFGGTWTRTRLSQDGYLPGTRLADSNKERTLLTSYRGTRVAFVYDGKVYASEGSGLELTHGKGDSQVLTVTLGAPQGMLRVTSLEGVTVTGNGTGNLSLTGPLGLINAILESLTYQGGADFTGAGGFTITAESSGVSTTQTNQVTVQDAAQPEMATSPTSTAITETGATLGGSVTANGGSALTLRGVVVSATATNALPVIGGNGVTDLVASGTTLGAFTVNATGLAANTAYSFRAYAINANGPQYSDLGTFTTAGATVPLVLVVGTGVNKVASISISKLQSRAGVLAGQAVTLVSTDPVSTAGGSVAIFGTTLRYTPATGYSGTDSFEVVFNQTGGGTFTGRVDVTVSAASGGRISNPPQVMPVAGGGIQVRFRGIPGVTYKIQRSTDLLSWQDMGTTIAGDTGEIQYTDPTPPSPSGFYRMVQP
jgi:NHL repeat